MARVTLYARYSSDSQRAAAMPAHPAACLLVAALERRLTLLVSVPLMV